MTAMPGQPKPLGRDEVNGVMIFKDRDVRMIAHALVERGDYGVTGCIGGMNDPPMAMSTFARQMKAEFGGPVLGERYAFVDQPFDGRTSVFHDEPCGRLVAQATTGDQRVANVVVDTVGRVEHGRNTALGPVAGAFAYAALGEDGNAPRVRQIQRHAQACQPATDDCHVEIHPATSPSIVVCCDFRDSRRWHGESLVGKDNARHATRPLGRSASRANRARASSGGWVAEGVPQPGARTSCQNRGAKAKSLA